MNLLKNLYDVVDVLKDGKHGKIFLVYDKLGKQIFVLKERNLQTAEIYSRLKNLQNPFVPKIYRTVQSDEKIFVVEEFIEGQTLAEILTYQKNFDEKLAAQILKQLCQALKPLHEQKIIHRDLKPSNIMLTKNNSVRLIDFSISRLQKNNSESDTDFLGTRGYAPPEQFGFGQTDSRSDIFSLGKTLQKILGENYDGYLKKILSKCTALDPANRYQSVEEILTDIDKKFWLYKLKKFLVLSAISFAVLIFPVKLFETEPPEEKISEPVEEVTEEKLPEVPQKIEQPKTNFPEIKFPETTSETPQKIFELPQETSPEKNLGDPRLNQVCSLYLNEKIFSAEIPANVWQNWHRDGEIFYFPANWNLTLRVDNKNNFALTDMKVLISLGGDKKNFSETILARQSKNFSVSLADFPLQGGRFEFSIRLTQGETIFSWQNGFGNYKQFQIYLMGYDEWRTSQAKK